MIESMNFIPKELAREIRAKADVIRDPSYYDLVFKENLCDICSLVKQKRKRRVIEKNAKISSYRIENPYLPVPYSVPKSKREIKREMKHIGKAFDWGIENFGIDGFEIVGQPFIKDLASIVNYGEKGKMDYRTSGTNISGASTTPPYPEKVRIFEMPQFVIDLKKQFDSNKLSSDVVHRLETAIYSHLHLVRIHPFVDGNGRTSRLLQDIILNHYGIPIPIIEPGERATYYRCLDRAVYDWKEREGLGKHGASEGERDFYTFIAGKINSSFDNLIECIS